MELKTKWKDRIWGWRNSQAQSWEILFTLSSDSRTMFMETVCPQGYT